VPGSRTRIAIRTLGCKVNRTESEALAEALLGSDAVVVDEADGADMVVVNTCTVTGEADAKARKEVRRALAACPGPVVVAGCLAALDPDGLRALDPRVVVESDRAALASHVAAILGRSASAPGRARLAQRRAAQAGGAFRTRVMVKVQDGCDRRCSYCIVPDARGVPRSVPAADVIARVRALAGMGTPEAVLTGINIGRYSDPDAGVHDLADLVDSLAQTGMTRVRVSSVEPLDLNDRLAASFARAGARVAPHLHVPLQSGCDRTLAEMGRGYDTATFTDALERMRAAMPGLAVTTDVIVGFPGETDDDFASSLAFVGACGFARLHVFRYSERAGTPAAARTDQIAPPVKAARAEAMRSLSDRLVRRHLEARDGQPASVLVERATGGGAVGTSEDGLRVRLAQGGARPGQIIEVTLRLRSDGTLSGDRRTTPVRP